MKTEEVILRKYSQANLFNTDYEKIGGARFEGIEYRTPVIK